MKTTQGILEGSNPTAQAFVRATLTLKPSDRVELGPEETVCVNGQPVKELQVVRSVLGVMGPQTGRTLRIMAIRLQQGRAVGSQRIQGVVARTLGGQAKVFAGGKFYPLVGLCRDLADEGSVYPVALLKGAWALVDPTQGRRAGNIHELRGAVGHVPAFVAEAALAGSVASHDMALDELRATGRVTLGLLG